MFKQQTTLMGIVFSGALLASCSTMDKSTVTGLASSTESGIHEAEVMDADQYAPVELRSAKMKLEDARSKIADNEYQQAQLLLEKAMVDAEYARVKTRSEKAQASAEQIQKDIRTLESQL